MQQSQVHIRPPLGKTLPVPRWVAMPPGKTQDRGLTFEPRRYTKFILQILNHVGITLVTLSLYEEERLMKNRSLNVLM
jgi:hypothetical protein